MANFPATLPSATPTTHGVVVDEVRAMAAERGLNVRYGSGLWYSPTMQFNTTSAVTSVGNVSLFREDFPPGTTITGLAINVVTVGSAGATKTLLIYNDDGTSSYPTTLQKATSALATDGSTGVKSETFTAEAVGGTRWLGTLTLVNTSTITGSGNGRGVGLSSIASANIPWAGYQQTGQSSAPATFTATRSLAGTVDRVLFQIG